MDLSFGLDSLLDVRYSRFAAHLTRGKDFGLNESPVGVAMYGAVLLWVLAPKRRLQQNASSCNKRPRCTSDSGAMLYKEKFSRRDAHVSLCDWNSAFLSWQTTTNDGTGNCSPCLGFASPSIFSYCDTLVPVR